MKSVVLSAAALAALAAFPAFAAAPTDQLNSISDRLVELNLKFDPTIAYFAGLPAPTHRVWSDHSLANIRAFERTADQLHAEFRRIDPKTVTDKQDRIAYALLKEAFEAEQQARVCKSELWMGVSHMGGWHLGLSQVAKEQPVETADERTQALERWGALDRFVDIEIANLRTGLAQGYSAPKPVVRRALKQVEGLAAADPEKSPLFSPAERSNDGAFKASFRAVLADKANPALKRYAEFLRTEYLPKARDTLGVGALPNGAACYQASLRNYTTLNRTGQEVHDIGAKAVAGAMATAQDLGEKRFGTRDIGTIQARVNEAPDNKFSSEEELVGFSREVVTRAKQKSAVLFERMPEQEVKVEPFEAHMRGSGASSHYNSQVDPSKPAYYRIATDHWQKETRGSAEITAVHEAYPGHHMQIAFTRTLQQTPLAKLSFNSAYIEGWARYSEALAEEAGIYDTDYALITRRMWPARGMVADPGLHVLGWDRDKVLAFVRQSGRFAGEEGDELVDRMAIIPGQLTAYDSGGLEIRALRAEAERELGAKFDIKGFHKAVLELGVVPLPALRENVRAWIAAEKAKGG